MMRGGDAGLAVLHHGEAVITSQGTKKNLNAIAAMNAGKTVGGGITIHGGLNITTNKLDRAYVRSRGFEDDITNALTRARAEGRF
jgi:hypothetical protein